MLRPGPPIPHKSLRLPRWRRMTICIGMRCSNGVIVAADTQESYGSEISYVTKIYQLAIAQNKAIVAGAGRSHFIDYAKDKIQTEVLAVCKNHTQFHAQLSVLMRRLYGDDFRKFPTDTMSEKDIQLLVAAQFGKGIPYLYSVDSTLVRHITTSRVIGIETLSPMAQSFQEMSLNMGQAAWAAIYVIKIAKERYQAVGGTTHVFGISSTGDFQVERTNDMPQREAAIGRLDRLTRLLLIGIVPPTGRPAFDAQIKITADFLKTTREDLEKIDTDFVRDFKRYTELNKRANRVMEAANKKIARQERKLEKPGKRPKSKRD